MSHPNGLAMLAPACLLATAAAGCGDAFQPLGAMEKQTLADQAMDRLLRIVVHTEETLALPDGSRPSQIARDRLADTLSRTGFTALGAAPPPSMAMPPAEQNALRKACGCQLAVLIRGSTRPRSEAATLPTFATKMRGRVIHLATHEELFATSVASQGRATDNPLEAAQDAHHAAAGQLARQIVRYLASDWEATSLIRAELIVANLPDAQAAADLRAALRQADGVHYVSVERWDAPRRVAHYEVLCRYDLLPHLARNVRRLQVPGAHVRSVRQMGQLLRAPTGLID